MSIGQAEMVSGTVVPGVTADYKITEETVRTVAGNGEITIQGREEIMTTTGVSNGQVHVGDIVSVGWRNGSPVVVLSHTAQRAKFVPTGGEVNGIVEELYVAEVDGEAQVWFRNFDQFGPLVYAEDTSSPTDLGIEIVNVVWGIGTANTLIIRGVNGSLDVIFLVYTLNRPEDNEPFPTGFEIEATLVASYNITTDPATFGTFTLTGSGPGQSGNVSAPLAYLVTLNLPSGAGAGDSPFPVIGTVQISQVMVSPNNDLLVVLRVQAAHVGDSGRTDQTFDMGSLLINVTRGGLVLANRLADSQSSQVYVTPSSAFVCTLVGQIQVDTSDGGSVNTAGVITLLSTTGSNAEDPFDPDAPGTFNNFVLLGPATVYAEAVRVENPPGNILGEIFCNPTRATLELSVQGEFSSRNIVFAEFPGSPDGPSVSQIVRYQGSRTRLLYAPYIERGGPVGPFFIRDLEAGVSQSSNNPDPDQVFGIGPPTEPNVQNPLIFAAGPTLIYSPFSDILVTLGEADSQFFVEQDDFDFDNVAPTLEEQAVLADPEEDDTTAEALRAVGTIIIQVLNSLQNIPEFAQDGPL